MTTLIYSILHMFVDSTCAYAMFGYFRASEQWALYLLIYNFCAFALQLPIGALLDALNLRNPQKRALQSSAFASIGVVLTIVGAITHPAVLGLGNAFFHVGGGVGTILEDRVHQSKGSRLGVFVAPGALGLFLGTCLGKTELSVRYIIPIAAYAVVMLAIAVVGMLQSQRLEALLYKKQVVTSEQTKHEISLEAVMIVSCFVVVILRSYVGLTIGFSWKSGFAIGLLAVVMVVGGKMLGGILAAKLGTMRVMIVSLVLAAICYLWKDVMPCGLIALLAFNMTMPITLYFLVERYPSYSGTSFGLLTLALFIGYALSILGEISILPGGIVGAIASAITLGLLILAFNLERTKKTA